MTIVDEFYQIIFNNFEFFNNRGFSGINAMKERRNIKIQGTIYE